ncbi:MAG: hypothetical protein K6G11_00905 [Lachnospiraceae bacterium]|nr:hypothetical protein [Lachnospiraceae bacterium]
MSDLVVNENLAKDKKLDEMPFFNTLADEEKEDFKKKYKAYANQDNYTKEEFEEHYSGFDTEYDTITSQMSLSQAYDEKYTSSITTKELKKGIVSEYSERYKGQKSLWFNEKYKRAKSAKKKISVQETLRKQKHLYLASLESEYRFNIEKSSKTSNRLLKNNADIGNIQDEAERVRVREENNKNREILLNWQYTQAQIGSVKSIYSLNSLDGNSSSAILQYQGLLEFVQDVDISKYSYDSDKDFVTNFAEKYKEIKKYSTMDDLYGIYFKLCEGKVRRVSETKIKAKAEFFKQLKEDYELRMRVISSKYYTLLSKDDVVSADPENLNDNPEFKQFVIDYKKLSKTEVGKGKDITSVYNKILEKYENEICEKNVQKVRGFMTDSQFDHEDDEAINIFLSAKEKGYFNELPQDNISIIKDYKASCEGNAENDGADQKCLKFMDDIFNKILSEGTIGGQQIPVEHKQKIEEFVNDYCKVKKQNIVYQRFIKDIEMLDNEFYIDTENKSFKTTPEYNIIKKFQNENAKLAGYNKAFQDNKTHISQILYNFTTYLVINDLFGDIGKKYEKEILDEYDKQTEIGRQHEKAISEGKNIDPNELTAIEKRRRDYGNRKFIVNGKEFETDGYIEVSRNILNENKEFTVPKDQEQELFECLNRVLEKEKKFNDMSAAVSYYSGFRIIFKRVYFDTKLTDENFLADQKRINEILKIKK